MSESALIKGCRNFEARAQQQLYQKYAPMLKAICMRYTQNSEDARDVLHDGFIKIYTKIGQYKEEGSFEGWMKRILINEAISFYRQKKKEAKVSYEEYYSPEEEGEYKEEVGLAAEEEQEVLWDYSREQLLEAIQRLPESYRTVFNMYYLDDFSHRQIADTLGIEESASKVRLHRARIRMQELLTGKKENKRS